MKSGIAYRQFCLRLPAPLMKRIELVAGQGNATKLIHKILSEYIDINYPDVSAIKDKISFHEKEIVRLETLKLNAKKQS